VKGRQGSPGKARISPLWRRWTLFGTGFSDIARRAKDWTIAGTGGVGISATLALSSRAIITSVRRRKAAAVAK
jgi:hypothetical protein